MDQQQELTFQEVIEAAEKHATTNLMDLAKAISAPDQRSNQSQQARPRYAAFFEPKRHIAVTYAITGDTIRYGAAIYCSDDPTGLLPAGYRRQPYWKWQRRKIRASADYRFLTCPVLANYNPELPRREQVRRLLHENGCYGKRIVPRAQRPRSDELVV